MKTLLTRMVVVMFFTVLLLCVQGCHDNDDVADPASPFAAPTAPTASGGQRVVTVGFWQNATCSGEMTGTISFPVDFGDTRCFTWPGRSGANSASRFSCGSESFNYTQWTTVTCSGGQVPEGTRKTVNISGCTQGVPPQQYGRILDFSGCQ